MFQSVETASGRISYAEAGTGPVALFVHGVLLNKHLWRHQLAALSDIRRCVAVDVLAHGDTEIEPDQDVSVTANANMLKEVLDALVGNPKYYEQCGAFFVCGTPLATEAGSGDITKGGNIAAAKKALAESGLIDRKDFGVVPPKVEYRLTRKGQSFVPVIAAIRDWGHHHLSGAESAAAA